MSGGDRLAVRSYQRIFRPERRIYQIEGHPLPVPGGVPLRWLAYATGALVAVIALSSRTPTLTVLLAAAAAAAALASGARSIALVAGAATAAASELIGALLVAVDWPLRLVVLPALFATIATQATPDGRPAHRYAISWLALQSRPARRSLGRALPAAGAPLSRAGGVWVAADHRVPDPRRARVRGPATVRFAAPVLVTPGRLLGRARWVVRYGGGDAATAGAVRSDRVELAAGERLELRP